MSEVDQLLEEMRQIQDNLRKWVDPKDFERYVEVTKAFNQWVENTGYFPHSKYFEAFKAGYEEGKEE